MKKLLLLLFISGCVTVIPCPEQEDPWRSESMQDASRSILWGFIAADSIGATYYDGCNTHTNLGNGYESVTMLYCERGVLPIILNDDPTIIDFSLEGPEPDSTRQ